MKALSYCGRLTSLAICLFITLVMINCNKEKNEDQKVNCGGGSGYPIEFCNQVDHFTPGYGVPGQDVIEVTCLVGPEGATVSNCKNGTYYCSGTYRLSSFIEARISIGWEKGTVYIKEPTFDCDIYQGQGTFTVAITKVEGGEGNIVLDLWDYSDFIFESELINTDCNKIEAPDLLTAVFFQDLNQVRLFWADNSHNETAFEIYRSLYYTSGYEKIGEVGENETSYYDEDYAVDQINYYQVRARNDLYFSEYTTQVSVNTDSVAVTVTDIDGNTYKVVRIGDQVWMAENLKVMHYCNGDPIPYITDSIAWGDLSTGAYCWYNNDSATYENPYGKLYNWFAVVDSRGLCPTGWHVPTDAEWRTLTDYLGGEVIAGGKLKETGTTHWLSPNTGATNERGFTALPGGCRGSDLAFIFIGKDGYWWSSTESGTFPSFAWYRRMYSIVSNADSEAGNKTDGFSVRCVRD